MLFVVCYVYCCLGCTWYGWFDVVCGYWFIACCLFGFDCWCFVCVFWHVVWLWVFVLWLFAADEFGGWRLFVFGGCIALNLLVNSVVYLFIFTCGCCVFV